MSKPRASVGIISIGEMGLGVAKLLVSQNYRVLTNITGRSQQTHDRAKSANITLLDSDIALYEQSDYILSIVPPKDALATALRIVEAAKEQARQQSSRRAVDGQQLPPLYYLDLNAVAPSTATDIAKRFDDLGDAVRFIDGGIIGGPPRLNPDADAAAAAASEGEQDLSQTWYRPSIVLSGPIKLDGSDESTPGSASAAEPSDSSNGSNSSSINNAHLAQILNTKHVGARIGDASGLKCCFASLSKGFTALAIQSFSTAAQLGVLDALRAEIRTSAPANETRALKGLVGMPPKSGRWVAEMREIGKTFREVGGWGVVAGDGHSDADVDGNGDAKAGGSVGGSSSSVFDEIAEVYRYVAEETVLGQEKSGHRVRGTTGEDVVAAILESRAKEDTKDA